MLSGGLEHVALLRLTRAAPELKSAQVSCPPVRGMLTLSHCLRLQRSAAVPTRDKHAPDREKHAPGRYASFMGSCSGQLGPRQEAKKMLHVVHQHSCVEPKAAGKIQRHRCMLTC